MEIHQKIQKFNKYWQKSIANLRKINTGIPVYKITGIPLHASNDKIWPNFTKLANILLNLPKLFQSSQKFIMLPKLMANVQKNLHTILIADYEGTTLFNNVYTVLKTIGRVIRAIFSKGWAKIKMDRRKDPGVRTHVPGHFYFFNF